MDLLKDLKMWLFNFNFVLIYIIYKILLLSKSNLNYLNPIRDGDDGVGEGGRGCKKTSPRTSLSLCNFCKERISSQNFLTFSFSYFATLVQNFKFVPSASPKLLNLNLDHPSKKSSFSGQILIKLRLR